MTRPIDIRDIAPRDAVLGDKRLGLDADENLAMTNQPDNSIIGTAASRNTGTAADQIPLNSDLPASAKSGDYNDLNNLPTLGTAAAKDTGLNSGDILTPEGAGLDGGEINLTTGNRAVGDRDKIGSRLLCGNISGGPIAPLGDVAGSDLGVAYFPSSTITTSGTLSGTWRNMTFANINNGGRGDFEKIS